MAEKRGEFTSEPSESRIHTNLSYYNSLWGIKKPAFPLGSQEFRWAALATDKRPRLDISNIVESCEWRDEGTFDNLNAIPVLRGSLTLRKPHPDELPKDLDLHDGNVIRCQVNWGGRWKEVWRMRVQKETVNVFDGGWTFELADDLQLASRSEYDYSFVSDKEQRKKGWRYWEIVRKVCKEAKIPLDKKMPKGRRWIKEFEEEAISPLEAIRQVVMMEEEWTGRKHVIFWRDGKLSIKRLRRNPLLFTLADQIRGGDISRTREADIFTAVTGSATGDSDTSEEKGGDDDDGSDEEEEGEDTEDTEGEDKPKKDEAVNKKAVGKYGYIHKTIDLGDKIESEKEMKHLLKQKIKESTKTLEVIEGLSHYGIAFIRRGDAIRVSIPSEKIRGEKGYLFVTTISHSVSAGDYTMSLDLTTTENDPLDPNEIREAIEKAERLRKHQQDGKDEEKKKDDEAQDDEDEEAEED
jgi:hypothetical protein